MNLRKIYVVAFVVLIISVGIFKSYITTLYSTPLNFVLSLLGIDCLKLTQNISFLAKDGSIDHGLGVFFYYPTYLVLHFALIHNLFYENKVLKLKLIYSLSIIVIGLGVLATIFKVLGLDDFYDVTFGYFELVVARPLILFLIEGGGMIYQQIEKSNAWNNRDQIE